MSLTRKLKRKNNNQAMKTMKKTVKKIKQMVKCTICDRNPNAGEKIDNWNINVAESGITLVCPECEVHHV